MPAVRHHGRRIPRNETSESNHVTLLRLGSFFLFWQLSHLFLGANLQPCRRLRLHYFPSRTRRSTAPFEPKLSIRGGICCMELFYRHFYTVGEPELETCKEISLAAVLELGHAAQGMAGKAHTYTRTSPVVAFTANTILSPCFHCPKITPDILFPSCLANLCSVHLLARVRTYKRITVPVMAASLSISDTDSAGSAEPKATGKQAHHLLEDVDVSRAYVPMLVCCFISGLTDATIYNSEILDPARPRRAACYYENSPADLPIA